MQVQISGLPSPLTAEAIQCLCDQTGGIASKIFGAGVGLSEQHLSSEKESRMYINLAGVGLTAERSGPQREVLKFRLTQSLEIDYPQAAVSVCRGEPVDTRKDAVFF